MNKYSLNFSVILLLVISISINNIYAQTSNKQFNKFRLTGLQTVNLKSKEQILTRIATQAQQNSYLSSSGPVNVSVVSLNGITGYPELDSMQLCGGPDTLAVLIFTNAPTPITNIALDLNYSGGIEFGGFLTTVPAGQIIPDNLSNPLSPKFIIPTLDQNNAIIAYVGVKTNCSALNNDNMNLEFEFNYFYNDGTGNKKYKDLKSFTSSEFAPAVLRPVLNIRNDPADLTFTNLNTNLCQTLTISQDGIRAALDSFEFTIDSLNTSLLNFVSLKINSLNYSFKIDTVNHRLTAIIKGSVFQSNSNNNGPANNYFNENETLSIEVCYSITGCINQPLLPILYSVKQICAGNTCFGSDDLQSEIFKFSPSFGANPVAIVTMLSDAEVCGNPAVLKIEFNSSVSDPLKGLYEDIDLRLNSCDSNFLHLKSITIGEAPNQFTLPDNLIGYTTAGQILVNLKDGLTSDPDGPGGLTDSDGDGYYDDLPGGQKLFLEVSLDVQCAEGLQGCAAVSCKIESVNVTGFRNCRTPFSASASTPNAPLIGFVSGGRYSNTNQLPNLTQGYNFGTIGYISGIDDTPSSQDMEFNYAFNPTNFVSCGGQHILQFAVTGPPEIVFDMEFSNVMSGMIGGPFTTANFTVIDSPNISTRFLRIEVQAPTPLDTFTCKWTATLDTSYCTPGIYFTAAATLVEECINCSCEIKKACRSITMYVDPQDIGCDCDMSSNVEIKRKTTGYTNTDLTTKLLPDQINPEDRIRFLPGDTMIINAKFKILDDVPFNDANAYLYYYIRNYPIGGDALRPRVRSIFNSELARTKSMIVKRGNTIFDVSTIVCTDANPNSVYRGLWQGTSSLQNAPFVDAWTNQPVRYYNANSSYDPYDGQLLYTYFFDEKIYGDGGSSNPATFFDNDCLNPYKNLIGGFQIGDSIIIQMEVPIIVNPGFDPSLGAEVEAQVFAYGGAVSRLPGGAGPAFSIDNGTCWTGAPYQFFQPELEGNSEIKYDPCGATVEHTFKITNKPPADWYTQEFRPILGIEQFFSTLPPPLVYAGGAKIKRSNGDTISIMPYGSRNNVSSIFNNDTTFYLPGQSNSQLWFNDAENIDGTMITYRTTDGVSPTLSMDQGDNDFTRIGGTFPLLGVGMDITDSLKFCIPLKRICPGTVDETGLELIYYASYPNLPNYNNPDGPWIANNHPLHTINGDNGTDKFFWSNCLTAGCKYWDYNSADTANVMRFPEVKGINYFTSGVLDGTLSLSAGVNSLIIGDNPLQNEVNRYTICTGPGSANLNDIVTSITVTSTVQLVQIKRVSDGQVMPFSTVYLGADSSIYSFNTAPSMAPNTCLEFDIYTELLLCPQQLSDPTSVPEPKVCLSSVGGGCLPPHIAALISGGTSSCAGASACYIYKGDPSDVQITWLGNPTPFNLCDQITMTYRVKNVRSGTLFDPTMDLILPEGLIPVAGSWEYAYPSGPFYGGTYMAAPDPANPTTNHFSYSDVGNFINSIGNIGLPGINSTLDSNYFSIRFKAIPSCVDFISGKKAKVSTRPYDACGNFVTASDISPALIANGANPVDFPRFLTSIAPPVLYCGVSNNTLQFTGYAISGNGMTSNARLCFELPVGITYNGNLNMIIPSTFVPTNLVVTGGGAIPTKVCFDLPDGIGIGGLFQFECNVSVGNTAICGVENIGIDISSTVQNLNCQTQNITCDAKVSNSLNNEIPVNIKAPIEIASLKTKTLCTTSSNQTTIAYEITFKNFGANYNNTTNLELYRDIDGNGNLDVYDQLLTSNPHTFSLLTNDSITINSTFTINNDLACPLLIKAVFGSGCACDEEIKAVNTIQPEFLANLPDDIYICNGNSIQFGICGNYNFSVSPIDGAVITYNSNLDSIKITLNNGYGVNNPVTLNITGSLGDCALQFSRSIWKLPSLEIGPYDTVFICNQNASYQLDVNLPPTWEGGATISWSPTTYLSDPTSPTPEVINPTTDVNYTVTVSFNNGQCSTSAPYVIKQLALEPPILYVVDNVCPSKIGKIDVIKDCGSRSYIEYSSNGGVSWSKTKPLYTSTMRTIDARCVFSIDTNCKSPSIQVVTNPKKCINENNECSIDGFITLNPCNNNSTNSLVSDDYFTIQVSANATGGGSTNRFEVVIGGDLSTGLGGNVLNSGGTKYGSTVLLGDNKIFKADGVTTYTLMIRDIDNNNCFQVIDFQAINPCSTNPQLNNCYPVPCVPIGTIKN